MNDEVDSDNCMVVRCWDIVLLIFCFFDIYVYICFLFEND